MDTALRAAPIPAVNYHCWPACNMRCRFCFAHFGRQGRGDGERLSRAGMLEVAALLGGRFEKVNFAGGEPTLCSWLPELVAAAAAAGAVTSVVSNGSLLDRPRLDALAEHLDWLCLSVDSLRPEVNLAQGRALAGRIPLAAQRILEVAALARERGIRIKLNTVVSSATWAEDLAPFISALKPERWKILRLLPIAGENDIDATLLQPSDEQFAAFHARHAGLGRQEVEIISEDNDAMLGSYLMVDPAGRFFDNLDGRLRLGRKILEIGLEQALVEARLDFDRFSARGGRWAWSPPAPEAISTTGSPVRQCTPHS